MFRLFLLALFLFPTMLLAQEYSHGDPTDEEQLMLEMINRARADPKAEGGRLMDTDDQSVQQSYAYWQIDKEKTKTAFNGYPTRPPLAFHPALITAARLHSADMAENNFQGHVGSNGSQLGQRLAAQGYTSQGLYGENVAAYATSVWFGHCGFNVDWGTQNQIDLGHRSNTMNFNGSVYTEIGVGILHTNGGLNQGTVGPLVITEDFGLRSVQYITGVVYDDKNHNEFYDVGEGLAGVKIQPSRGGAWAVSSSSGGYAIPFSGSGAVTVTASGGPLGNPIVLNTSFEGTSIKVDFVPAAQVPGLVVLTSPANNAKSVDPKGVVLTWQNAAFVESYQLQVATASSFTASSILLDGPVQTASTSLSAIPCGQQVYWRVRGVNAIGPGPWSTPFNFTTSGVMAGNTSLIAPKGTMKLDNMGTVPCTWKAATGAELYHVRFSTNSGFTQVFAEDSTLTGTSFSIPVSTIPSGANTFYWSARAGNDCGWGPWSGFSIVSFTITTVEDVTTAQSIVSIVPNPVTTTAQLRTSAPLPIGTIVDVLGLQGNKFGTLVITGSSEHLDLDGLTHNSLANGVYVVRILQPDGTTIRQPFVVAR